MNCCQIRLTHIKCTTNAAMCKEFRNADPSVLYRSGACVFSELVEAGKIANNLKDLNEVSAMHWRDADALGHA